MDTSVDDFREQVRQLAIRDRHHEVLELLQQAPVEIIQTDEDLAFWHALCLLSTVKYVEGRKATESFIERFASLDNPLARGRGHLLQSHLHIMDGNTEASYEQELKVVSILPESAYHERLRSWATIDTMAGHMGDDLRMEQAVESLADVRNNLPFDQSWWYSFVVPNRADILAKRGYLEEAESLLLAQLPTVPQEGVEIIKLRLAVIALEHQQPAMAAEWLEAVPYDGPSTYWTMEAALLASQVARILGDPERAERILQDIMAEKSKNHIRAELYRAQLQLAKLWIEEGEAELADSWLRLASKSLDPWPRTFGHPVPNLIQAELEMVKGNWKRAISLLEALRDEGIRRGHTGILVGIYAHLAYVYASLDDDHTAREIMNMAIEAGKHGNFARSLTVLGVDIRDSFSQPSQMLIRDRSAFSGERHVLSERELEVLQLVAEGMRNAEIAASLYLSNSTIKNHLANIYRRLGVSNRRSAVQAARQMGLLQVESATDS